MTPITIFCLFTFRDWLGGGGEGVFDLTSFIYLSYFGLIVACGHRLYNYRNRLAQSPVATLDFFVREH